MTDKSNIENNMESRFDLAPAEPIANEIEIVENDNKSIEDDFEYARQNLRSLIDSGVGTLEEIAQVASVSESPRAYEVVATLMNTMLSANKDLMDLHKKNKEINKKEESSNQQIGTATQNNYYVGTTSDLQKLIEENR